MGFDLGLTPTQAIWLAPYPDWDIVKTVVPLEGTQSRPYISKSLQWFKEANDFMPRERPCMAWRG